MIFIIKISKIGSGGLPVIEDLILSTITKGGKYSSFVPGISLNFLTPSTALINLCGAFQALVHPTLALQHPNHSRIGEMAQC